MARSQFGGTVADFVFTTSRFSGRDLVALTSATLTFWDAESGGTQHTDLLVGGSPATVVTVGSDGQIPLFEGPDGVTVMWATAGGARVRMVTTDAAAVAAERQAAEAAAASVPSTAELNASYALPPKSRRVWAIGDSVTDNGNAGAGQGSGRIGTVLFGSQSYLGAALARLDGRVRYGGVAATGGYTATQVRDTHLPTILANAQPGDLCVVLAGANDPAASGLATPKAALADTYQQLTEAGITPVLCTLTPTADAARDGFLQSLNGWVQDYALSRGLPFVDFYQATVNTATNDLAAAYDSGDGVHPNGAGAWVMGERLAAAIEAHVPAAVATPLFVTNAYPDALIASNNVFLTDGDANGRPDGGMLLAAIGTSTTTLSTDAAYVGKKLVTTVGDSDVMYRVASVTLTPGNRVVLAVKVKAASSNWSVKLINTAGHGILAGYLNIGQSNGEVATVVFDFTVPAGWPTYTFGVDLNNQGTNGETVEVGQVTCRDLTAEGAAA